MNENVNSTQQVITYLDSLHHLSRDEIYTAITPYLIPREALWRFPPLFKKRKDGKIHVWTIGFDGNCLYTVSGLMGGKEVPSPIAVPPKQNNNSPFEQAFFDARSRYVDKIVLGYRFDVNAVPDLPDPMLAKEYKDEKQNIQFPCAAQPKLDGIRMMVTVWSNGVSCRSRGGRQFTAITHIIQALSIFMTFMSSGEELDGELYNHNMNISQIQSIVSTKKTQHPQLMEIQYVIFDVRGTDLPYDQRHTYLRNRFEAYINAGNRLWPLILLGYDVVNSHDEIAAKHDEYTNDGYEGLMVRFLGSSDHQRSLYQPGRSANLLKFKKFITEEGIIVDVDTATGSQEGAAVFHVRDTRGITTRMTVEGTIENRRVWAEHPQMVIGRIVTFTYQNLTEYGNPRFPHVIAFRDPAY